MVFTIDGKDYEVPRESLYTPEIDNPGHYNAEIMFIDGWDEYLVGLTFLQNYYAVYDMENQRVGLAIA